MSEIIGYARVSSTSQNLDAQMDALKQSGCAKTFMNKASCLSLVSNAVLYWNTLKINDIVEGLRQQGEEIDDETLSHISLLPFKHVVPNGTYFIEDI